MRIPPPTPRMMIWSDIAFEIWSLCRAVVPQARLRVE
jgi:hypothetical protein